MRKFIFKILLFNIVIGSIFYLFTKILPFSRDNYWGEYFKKIERVKNPQREPSVILLGGSNVTCGFISEVLEDSLHLPIINAGFNAGLGLKFIIDDCFKYLKKNDILILSPEYSHFFYKQAYGEGPLANIFYLNFPYYFPLLNSEQLRVILTNTPLIFKSKILKLNTSSSQDDPIRFNSYGDFIAHWNDTIPKVHIKRDVRQNLSSINLEFINYLSTEILKLKQKGVQVLVYPPAFLLIQFENILIDIEAVDSILARKCIPFVCSPCELAFDSIYIDDTVYHLNKKGALKRTLHLIKTMKSLDIHGDDIN